MHYEKLVVDSDLLLEKVRKKVGYGKKKYRHYFSFVFFEKKKKYRVDKSLKIQMMNGIVHYHINNKSLANLPKRICFVQVEHHFK
jgi:hypothetical protein